MHVVFVYRCVCLHVVGVFWCVCLHVHMEIRGIPSIILRKAVCFP